MFLEERVERLENLMRQQIVESTLAKNELRHGISDRRIEKLEDSLRELRELWETELRGADVNFNGTVLGNEKDIEETVVKAVKTAQRMKRLSGE